MLRNKLIQTLGLMLGFGLIGLTISYIIFGHEAGDYISLLTILFTSGTPMENASPSLPELDAMRNNILAGGVAGMLTGLLSPVLFTHLQNRI